MSKQQPFSVRIKEHLDNELKWMNDHPSMFANNPDKDFTRSNRRQNPGDIVQTFLFMGNGTQWAELQKSAMDVTDSAFVQAKEKVRPEAAIHLLDRMNMHLDAETGCHGQRLVAFDGSDIYLPPFKVPDEFIQTAKGRDYALLHLNTAYDVTNERFIGVSAVPRATKDEGEIRQAICMVDNGVLKPGDIGVFDRGYCSLNLLRHITEMEANAVIRGRKNWIRQVGDLPDAETDNTVDLHITTRQTKEVREAIGSEKFTKVHSSDWDYEKDCTMTIRIVKFQLPTGTWETLVTTLLDHNVWTKEKLKELYHRRWGCETAYRHLKYTFAANSLHSLKFQTAILEIYAKAIMYNIVSAIVQNAYKEAKCTWKNPRKINFSKSATTIMGFMKPMKKWVHPPDEEIKRLTYPVREKKPGARNFRAVVHSVTYMHRAA